VVSFRLLQKQAASAPLKLEVAAEDLPSVQLEGLDPDDIIPPSPSPTTPQLTNRFGLDADELTRGLHDESDDDDEEEAAAATVEEGVPPAAAVAATAYEEEEWDDV
jgi:hypothetical protein